MKLIFMSETIEYIVNSIKTKEVIEWATNLMKVGEVKQTKNETKYIVLENPELE